MPAVKVGLRSMIMGMPLGSKQGHKEMVSALNKHLLAVIDLIPQVYGDNEPSRQAVLEVGTVVDMDGSRECLACKRAMLMYALATETVVCSHWQKSVEDGSAGMANDLSGRVLPFLMPRYFKNSCQAPAEFVQLALVLSEMWKGEQLGNFPLSP